MKDHTSTRLPKDAGPVRTMGVGDRITVYGDLEIIAVKGRRVKVRVVPASSPPPTGVMFPAKDR